MSALAQISDLYSDNLLTTMNSVSKISLCNSPKSLSFNCRGRSLFKQKFHRVHAVKEWKIQLGLNARIVLYPLSLHGVTSKVPCHEGPASVVQLSVQALEFGRLTLPTKLGQITKAF